MLNFYLRKSCCKYAKCIAISVLKSFKKLIILVQNLVDSLFLKARAYLSAHLVKVCSNDARIAWKIAGTVLFLSPVDAAVGRMV